MCLDTQQFRQLLATTLTLCTLPTLSSCVRDAVPETHDVLPIIQKWSVTNQTKVYSSSGIKPLGDVLRTNWKNLDYNTENFIQTEGYLIDRRTSTLADPSGKIVTFETYSLVAQPNMIPGTLGYSVNIPISSQLPCGNSAMASWGSFEPNVKYRVYGMQFWHINGIGGPFTALKVDLIK